MQRKKKRAPTKTSKRRRKTQKPPPLTPYLVIAGAVLVHITFLLSLHTGFLDPLFNDSTHRLPRGMDFFAVYQKAHEFSTGGSLYTDVDYQDVGSLVVPHCAPHYRYLPSWGWFMSSTFCLLDAENAYWLWVVLCELMLLVCLWMFLRRSDNLTTRAGLCVVWLCFSPYYLELFVGQFTFMAIGLITLALLAFADGRERRGSIWLTISIALKYVGGILLVPLLLRRRRRNVLAIIVVIVLIGAMYFIPNPDDWKLFTGVATYGTPNQLHAGNLGLQGLLGNVIKLLPDASRDGVMGNALRLILLKALPATLILFLIWVTWRNRSSNDLIPICLLWPTVYFLAGTDVFEHHYVILLPVFAFAWLRRPSPWLLLLYVWIALPTIFAFVDVDGLPKQRFVEVEKIWWQQEQYARIFLYHLWKIVPATWLFVWLFRLIEKPSARVAE
ncbi:MAG: DUF2029 domain-containing protein [Candidatus Latescibacterota bacterium]|nr:MAG: DUF2029 domain-containing protein [Candidatus Latescibacterota bacterium]